MKKVLTVIIILFFIFPFDSTSQIIIEPSENENYSEYMDRLIEPLLSNNFLLSDDILYDRVFPIANINNFSEQAASHVSSFTHFMQAWSELFKASIGSPVFLSTEDARDVAYHFERENVIQVGIINIDYKSIDSMALDENNPLLEITGDKIAAITATNPFVDRHALIISPLNSHTIQGSSVEFEFGKIILEKTDLRIKNLSATFEKGQSFLIISNGLIVNPHIDVVFSESGIKEAIFSVTYEDNTVQEAKAKFLVNVENDHLEKVVSEVMEITAAQPFQGYDEPFDCDGSCLGKGEYKIYYAGDEAQLTKPFIVLDGFDPHDKRKISRDEADDPADDNIYNLMSYIADDGKKKYLVQELNDEGFDVIILSFPVYVIGTRTVIIYDTYDYETGQQDEEIELNVYRDGGADYIERNAKVVEALIDMVNELVNENGSTEELVVIGTSSGGLTARYALAEMEQNNVNHNVRLFVSFEGEHYGANIQIGLQFAIDYFGIEAGLYALNTVAAKQMLLNHYLSGSQGLPMGAPGFRDRFQTELNNIGFPSQCRNVALVNGSLTGQANGIVGGNALFAEGLSGTLGTWGHLEINHTRDGGSSDVFRYVRGNLWGYNTQVDITKRSASFASTGSFDNSSGGYFPMTEYFENNLGSSPVVVDGYSTTLTSDNISDLTGKSPFLVRVISDLLNIYAQINLTGNFSFVPVKSSLAFTGANRFLREDLSCRDLVCTGETSFDSYYAPAENEAHILLTSKSIDWLKKEILGDPQPPTVYNCGEVTLEGSEFVCANEEAVFYLESEAAACGVPSTATSWEVSSNLEILSSDAFSIIIRPNSNNSTTAWIRVTLENGETIVKTIFGKPIFTIESEKNGNNVQITATGLVIDLAQQHITNIQWVQTGGNGLLAPSNTFSTSATGSGNNWFVEGEVTITNACGSSTQTFTVGAKIEEEPFGGIDIIKVGINTYNVVSLIDLTPQIINQAELYDVYGAKIKDLQPSASGSEIVIDTEGLGGLKLLKVVVGTEQKSKIISID